MAQLGWTFWVVLSSCTEPAKQQGSWFTEEERSFLQGLSLDSLSWTDETNAVSGNLQAIAWGKQLFFDRSLAGKGGKACADCHQPAQGFSDGQRQSQGVGHQVTKRTAPSLWGAGAQRWFNWDGSCDTLWCQAIGPLENPVEMNSDRVQISWYIQANYETQYSDLFGALPVMDKWPMQAMPVEEQPQNPLHQAWQEMSIADQKQSTQVLVGVAKSIAAYVETLKPPAAPIDELVAYLASDEEQAFAMLSEQEKQGLDLFIGDGQCQLCHFGPLLSNGEFHNIGLGFRDWLDDEDMGRYMGIDRLQSSSFHAAGPWSDAQEGEKALRIGRLAFGSEQLGQYKTPTLREVVHTAPYMHVGHFDSLEDVLEFYVELEESTLHGHREELLQPLLWEEQEIDAVIAFLRLFSSSQ